MIVTIFNLKTTSNLLIFAVSSPDFERIDFFEELKYLKLSYFKVMSTHFKLSY